MAVPMDQVQRRYETDVAFRHIVDLLQHAIVTCQLTPSEVREAAWLASYRVECRTIRPMMRTDDGPTAR